jgi:hypothetical protein
MMPQVWGHKTRFRFVRVGQDATSWWLEGANHPDGPYTRLGDEAAVDRLLTDVATSNPEGK